MSSIRLSQKHGVNPTIPVCFWCGKPKNEIALLGRLKDDAEAPKHCVIDFEPCDECQQGMNQGFTVMEATQHPNDHCDKPLGPDAYPTGRFVVLRHEAAQRIFQNVDLSKDKAFMDTDLFGQLFNAALAEADNADT